jgi:hypothetical protein
MSAKMFLLSAHMNNPIFLNNFLDFWTLLQFYIEQNPILDVL